MHSETEKAQNEDKRGRRRHGVEMLSPTVPNELNYALLWLIMGQIQKFIFAVLIT